MFESVKNKVFTIRTVLIIIPALFMSVADGLSAVNAQENDVESGFDINVQPDDSGASPASQLEWVREQTVLAKQVFDRVKIMLDQARQEKDTLKITCLDDKFTQIHVSLRGIEDRTTGLELSIKSGDMNAANQNMSILKIYFSRIYGLNSEAENCLGDTDVVLGNTETSTSLNADENITEILDSYDPDPNFSADSTDTTQQAPSKSEDPDGFDDVQHVLSPYV